MPPLKRAAQGHKIFNSFLTGGKTMKKLMSVAMSVLLICAIFCSPCYVGAAQTQKSEEAQEIPTTSSENSYAAFLEKYSDYSRPISILPVSLNTLTVNEGDGITIEKNFAEKEKVVKFEAQEGSVSFLVDVPKTGLYSLRLTMMPMLDSNRGIEFGITVNGETPYKNAGSFTFSCVYRDEAKEKDNRGNDITPRQIKQEEWVTAPLYDPEGLYDDPLLFAFTEGVNTITLNVNMGAFYIADIELFNSEALSSYADKLSQWKQEGAKEITDVEPIIIEGEDALNKSDPVLIPKTDRSSAATSPSSPALTLLNTISSSKFGQSLTWKINVPQSGLYKLGMRFSQKDLRGFFVSRRISVDGTVPFEEFSNIKFFYKNAWQYTDLSDSNGNPYLVYLEAGEHEITVEVVLGDFSPIVRELNAVMTEMSTLYRKIIMITSADPDPYMDYKLEAQIDGFDETLLDMAKRLRECGEKMESFANSKGSEAAFLYEIADQLDSLEEYPETINTRLERYSANLSSLSSWIFDKQVQPMTIDYIRLSAANEAPAAANAGFFQNLWFRIRAVLASFVTDYSAIGTVYEGKEALNVWIGGGSDQAGVLKRLIDDWFVAEYDIPVNLSLVQGSLLEATFAGQGPDLSLTMDANTVMNLAVRGLLLPLSDKDGYDEAIKDLHPESTVPFTQNGICYALPVTESFNMMFYRTDIFEELNLEPPETWEDFERVVSILQSNNMSVGLGSVFDDLLLQNGLTYYNEDLSATIFDQPEAVEVFKRWTQFYTQSTLPDTYNFYNRFRTGEMPLGIQSYTEYNQLAYAAPEIKNLWKMVPLPGTRREDGTIDRSQAASGSGAVILKVTEMKDEAWQFLKWWASAEVQARYGQDIEIVLGTSARYTPANREAFKQLPWSNSEIEVLLAQWDQVHKIPEIPAGYYVSRGITNAFRDVIYNNENPREALFYQNKLINAEITRKREELNLD